MEKRYKEPLPKLKLNIQYTTPANHTYTTDNNGRISSVKGKLSLDEKRQKKLICSKNGW